MTELQKMAVRRIKELAQEMDSPLCSIGPSVNLHDAASEQKRKEWHAAMSARSNIGFWADAILKDPQ